MINKTMTSIIISLSISSACFADDSIKWIAQDYPPYSYIDDNENKAGIAVDIAAQIMKKIGSNQTTKDIDIKTFSKFFIRMNDSKNTVFFPLLRTSSRDKYFKWAGPVGVDEPVLLARVSSNIVISKATDLNNYSIASIDGYNAVKELIDKGVNDSVFKLNSSDMEDASMLMHNSVNIMLCNKISCEKAIIAAGGNIADYTVIYKLPTSKFFFAFNKDTSDELISKVQAALDQIKQRNSNGVSEYDKIMKIYAPTAHE